MEASKRIYHSVSEMMKEMDEEWKNTPFFHKVALRVYWNFEDFIKWFKPSRIGFNLFCLYQRIRYGFCDKDLWNLDYTIARFVYPRLKRFIEKGIRGCPSTVYDESRSEEENFKAWKEILNKMLLAFDMILNEDKYVNYKNSQSIKKDMNNYWNQINEGMILFAQHFSGLWD